MCTNIALTQRWSIDTGRCFPRFTVFLVPLLISHPKALNSWHLRTGYYSNCKHSKISPPTIPKPTIPFHLSTLQVCLKGSPTSCPLQILSLFWRYLSKHLFHQFYIFLPYTVPKIFLLAVVFFMVNLQKENWNCWLLHMAICRCVRMWASLCLPFSMLPTSPLVLLITKFLHHQPQN